MKNIAFTVCLLIFACLNLDLITQAKTVGNELGKADPKVSMVSIFSCGERPTLKCLGVLIGPKYVLTSASCVYGSSCLNVQKEKAIFGNETDKQRLLKKIINHPFYIHGSPNYDIAVLEIQEFAEFKTDFQLPTSASKPGEEVQIGGWNSTDKEKGFQALSGKVIDRTTCQSMHSQIIITSRIICVDNSFSSTIGGCPIFSSEKLVGIAMTSQSQTNANLFANIFNTEIFSFVKLYYIPSNS